MPEMELTDSVTPPAAPAPEATPSPAPTPEATPAPEPEATPAPEPEVVEPTAPQLYRLPDGRQVDATGLQREYENLLPEFTRKSQELAAFKNADRQNLTNEQPPWKDPNFAPASWADAIEIAKAEALKEMTRNAEAAQAAEASVRAGVAQALTEIKAADPKLDDNALFEHAVKYGFTDLRAAHSNFKAMRDAVLQTEQRVAKNFATRAADPIATTPTPPPVAKTGNLAPAANIGHYRGALDFLAAVKSKN